MAGVSKATAARLFKLLGYSSFDEARRESRNLRHWGAPTAPAPGLSDAPTAVHHLNLEINNLRLTFERLEEAVIEAVTQELVRTRRVWIVGLRGSFAIGQYARFLFQMLKPDVRFIPAGGLSFAEEAVDFCEGDVLLAVGYRRRPAILLPLLEQARQAGVIVALITDLTASRTAESAHYVIRCSSEAPYSFDSYTSGISVINYLGSRLMNALGEEGVARIEKKEQLHEQLDPFTDPALPSTSLRKPRT